MRIMGLDVGSKTVGVAISDPMGWTAQGLEIIRIDEEAGEFGMVRLKELTDQYEPETIVVGLPKNMNNSIGFRAKASQAYGDLIVETLGIPVAYIDERLTTVQAEKMLISEGNVSRAKRKKVIDKLAAVILLQNYLDSQ